MSKHNGMNVDLVREMYAAKYVEMQDKIAFLERRIEMLQRDLDAANVTIAEYKNVVFKTQMKLDAATAGE
jgi:uncharacterized coiled-coil protein SlyX